MENTQSTLTVVQKVAALNSMKVRELRDKYAELFGMPTHTNNKAYLVKRLAYRIQELAEGGLSQHALDRIEELSQNLPERWRAAPVKNPDVEQAVQEVSSVTASLPANRDPRLPLPGTILTKKYKGVEHRVTILDSTFECNGQIYSSLSKIAKAIAGCPWNGYTFFGLAQRKEG